MRASRMRGASSGRGGPGLPGSLAAALSLALSALGIAPATAEIYRCVSVDGHVSFSDNPSACLGAGLHVPQSRIQTVIEKSPDTPSAPAAPIRRSSAAESGRVRSDQELWQGKKLRAQAEFQTLHRLVERLERGVADCNRGTEFFARESDTGIKYRVTCDEIRKAYVDSRSKSRRLREYLDGGLRQECRRAGCLPGWIR